MKNSETFVVYGIVLKKVLYLKEYSILLMEYI